MLDFLMISLISQRFQFQLINNNGLVDQNGCLLITASKEAHLKDQHFERINWIQNTSHWLSVRQPNGRLLVHHFSIILFVCWFFLQIIYILCLYPLVFSTGQIVHWLLPYECWLLSANCMDWMRCVDSRIHLHEFAWHWPIVQRYPL